MGRFTKLHVALIALGLALGLALFATVVGPSTPDGGVDAVDSSRRSPGGELASDAGESPAHRADVPTRASLAPRIPQIRGTCVARETGARLGATAWRWHLLAPAGAAAANESHVDAGGAFSMDRPAAGGELAIRVDARGRVPLQCRLDLGSGDAAGGGGGAADAGGDLDLGTLALRAGREVRGVLHDPAGRPFPGARLSLRPEGPSHVTGRMFEVAPAIVTTAVDGAFRLPDPVAAGGYSVTLKDAPPLVSARTIRIDPGAAPVVLDLTCAATSAADQIRGRTLNSRGGAAEGVVVRAARTDRKGFRFSTTSRADGSFVLFRPPSMPRDRPVAVSVSSFSGGEEHGAISCAWGRTDLDLVLRAAQRLRVEVVEAATGEPVREFVVRCFATTGAWGGPTDTANLDREHGIAWVPKIRSGHHLVVVYPRGAWAERCVPSLPVACDVPAGEDGDLRIELQERRAVEVVATYADGSAVAGSTVALFWLHGIDRLDGRTSWVDLPELFENGAGRHGYAVRLVHGQTDATGTVRLDWFPSGTKLTLRITGEHAAFQRDDFVFARVGQTTGVVVARGGTLRGRFTPGTSLRYLHVLTAAERDRLAFLREHESPAVAARYWARVASGVVLIESGSGGRRLPRQVWMRFPVDEDGGIAIDGIPAGTWSVYLDRRTAKGVFARSARPIATLAFADGQEREESFDLRGRVEPGVVAGEVRLHGAPLGDALIRVTWRTRDAGLAVAGSARTNAAGSFQIDGLPPRWYQLDVQLGNSSIPLGARFDLRGGARHAEVYSLETSAVRLELRDAAGPVVARRVEVRGVGAAGKGLRWRRRTDAAGVLVLTHVPPGTYRLAKSTALPIVVKPGIRVQTFKRRL